ncbi:MAG: hypothetical protein P8P74_12630 [Crocinitomicaceae bacterium]|nr:hypothetical protein [Crocinitomicaceae bacterium]
MDRAIGRSSCVDDFGNIYTTGTFTDSLSFEGEDGKVILYSEGELWEKDIFLVKLNPKGMAIWAIVLGGKNHEKVYKMRLDRDGNIVLVGCFNETIKFSEHKEFLASEPHGQDGFLAKYSNNGELIMATRVDGAILGRPANLTIDNENNIIVIGMGAGRSSYIGLVKFSFSGDILWEKRFGGSHHDFGAGVDCDSSGNVYVAGFFKEDLSFHGEDTLFNLSSNGRTDAFILKMNSDGLVIWSKNIGGRKGDKALGIGLGTDNDIYILGSFTKFCSFKKDGAEINLEENCMGAIFIQKMNLEGSTVWVKKLEGSAGIGANRFYVDASGYITMTGFFKGMMSIGDPNIAYNEFDWSGGDSKHFIVQIDSEGDVVWQTEMNSYKIDGKASFGIDCMDLTVDKNGVIYSTGYYGGKHDFNISKEEKINVSNNGNSFSYFLQKIAR